MRLPLAALALIATPAIARDRYPELVAAERAFAADAGKIGITAAFRRHAAREGVLLRPDPVPAHEALARDTDTPDVTLEWGPETAALARSGDLGFTTGPYRLRTAAGTAQGRYLTVWRRGTDGRWGWLLDHGLLPAAGDIDPYPGVVTRLPAGRRATSGIAAANDALDAAWRTQGGTAIVPLLAGDALVLRQRGGRLSGVAARDALRGEWGVTAARRLGLFESRGGDLAVSYGAVTAEQKAGHYVRVWRHGAAGWRLIVDELVWQPPTR